MFDLKYIIGFFFYTTNFQKNTIFKFFQAFWQLFALIFE